MTCFTVQSRLAFYGIILIGYGIDFDWCADLIDQINAVVVVHSTLLTNEIARFYCLFIRKVGSYHATG